MRHRADCQTVRASGSQVGYRTARAEWATRRRKATRARSRGNSFCSSRSETGRPSGRSNPAGQPCPRRPADFSCPLQRNAAFPKSTRRRGRSLSAASLSHAGNEKEAMRLTPMLCNPISTLWSFRQPPFEAGPGPAPISTSPLQKMSGKMSGVRPMGFAAPFSSPSLTSVPIFIPPLPSFGSHPLVRSRLHPVSIEHLTNPP